VFPLMEGAKHHHLAEHTTRFARGMLRNPRLQQRTDLQPDFNLRANIFNPSGLFVERGIFPRRGKTCERVRFGMEAVDTVCGSRHAAAINESLAHDTKPAFKPVLMKERWDFCMFVTVWRGKELLFAQERRGIFAEALQIIRIEIGLGAGIILQICVPKCQGGGIGVRENFLRLTRTA
jgi:hypothetical protein